jgi:hypothetical protein
LEIDLATGKPLWSMTRVFDVAPLLKTKKPVAEFFKAYWAYIT